MQKVEFIPLPVERREVELIRCGLQFDPSLPSLAWQTIPFIFSNSFIFSMSSFVTTFRSGNQKGGGSEAIDIISFLL